MDVAGLFDFNQLPGAAEGVLPDGGPIGQGGHGETGTINVGGCEAVRSRELAFAFGAGDLTRGCINAQLLIVQCIGLAVVKTGRPIGKEL